MLVERRRAAEDDNADSGFTDCGDVGLGCCGDANGDAPPTVDVVDDVVGSLRRVDSRLMNDVLCLKR